jgi:hypothetical protein
MSRARPYIRWTEHCDDAAVLQRILTITCASNKRENSNLKMLKFSCLLTIVLMLQVSRACNGHNEEEQLAAARQQSDEYFASAYGYTPNPWGSAYYQPSVPGKYITNFIIFVSIFDSINISTVLQFKVEYFSSPQSRSPFTGTNIQTFNKQHSVTSEYIFLRSYLLDKSHLLITK